MLQVVGSNPIARSEIIQDSATRGLPEAPERLPGYLRGTPKPAKNPGS